MYNIHFAFVELLSTEALIMGSCCPVILTSTAYPKGNPQDDVHDEVRGETLNQGGDKLHEHGDKESCTASKSVRHPAEEISPEQLTRIEDSLCKWNVLFGIIA